MKNLSAPLVLLLIAVSLSPIVFSAWLLNQANAHIARAASLPADSPNRAMAIDQANVSLGSANVPRVAIAQARVALLRGDASRAAESLRASGSALRDDVIAQMLWADAEWQSSNQAAAFEKWRAAGAIEFFMNEANRARDRHQWQAMAQAARIAVGIAPERAEAHYALGDALSQLSIDDPAALPELGRAAELARDNEFLSTVLSRQGEILVAQGHLSAAFDLFDRAMSIAPLDARPRTDYARALWQSQPDARDRAEAMLKQSIAMAPWDVTAFITLAQIAESRGDASGAEDSVPSRIGAQS